MIQFLLACIVLMVACILMNMVSKKLYVLLLLVFVGLGMLFSSESILAIPSVTDEAFGAVSSLALVFIVFYAGLATNLKAAKPVWGRSAAMSTGAVVITCGLVGLFCHFALKVDWEGSFLIGSILSCTDSSSVFSIIRSRILHLKENTASILELESASNNVVAYLLVAVFLAIRTHKASGWALPLLIGKQLLFGALAGFLVAFVCVWVYRRLKKLSPGFDLFFMVGVALLSYYLAETFGGSGYLSCLICGFVCGNSSIRKKEKLVKFFENFSGMCQMMIFFLLGLLSTPSKLWESILPMLALAVFIIFVARPLITLLMMAPFGSSVKGQKLLTSWAGMRGASAVVLALYAVQSGEPQLDLIHIVFTVVVTSTLLQGTFIPLVAKRMKMTDDSSHVMRTFNDYSEQVPSAFLRCILPENHEWVGQKIGDLVFSPDQYLVMVLRRDTRKQPRPDLMLEKGDILYFTSSSTPLIGDPELSEWTLQGNHPMIGKKMSQIQVPDHALVLMIRRKDRAIVPDGDMILCEGDVLVLDHEE